MLRNLFTIRKRAFPVEIIQQGHLQQLARTQTIFLFVYMLRILRYILNRKKRTPVDLLPIILKTFLDSHFPLLS